MIRVRSGFLVVSRNSRCMGTLVKISTICTRGSNFYDFLIAVLDKEHFQKGSTLKGKNLLLMEQILSYKS